MNNVIEPELLRLIRCPVTLSELAVASSDQLQALNEKIRRRELVNRIGQTVETPLDSGLVNADHSLLLPIRDGIVVLVTDQAISLKD